MKSDMSGIPVFITAAESENFARAAEKLHLTRSAVAKTVARLEEKLGVTLFLRTTRSQSLTDEGALYYEHCRRALAEISAAEDILDGGKLQASGRLRVSVPVLLGHLCIAPLLTKMAQAHPQLQLEISFSDRQVDLAQEGFDLAVRVGTLADSTRLVARSLASHSMILCAAPDYLRRAGNPASTQDLARHAAVGYLQRGRLQKWSVEDSDGKIVEVAPPARLLMDDLQGIKDSAASGAGVAWLPYWLVRDRLADGSLQEVLPGHSPGRWPIYAVWPHTPYLALKVRVAIDALVEGLPAMMARVEAQI